MRTVFVTGATGLLGSNLVRALVSRGDHVRALARSERKAREQIGDLANVEIVVGDMDDIGAFAAKLQGCDVLFHTAAHFRDSYKGGNHRATLERINVEGTRALLATAYAAGIRKMVHTSSTAVLEAPTPGAAINETNDRPLERADDYFRSKILSERAVQEFLASHPDFDASFVLPGWMCGPGDAGPTSAGQLVLDVVRGKIPGIPPGAFSLVDARDVAAAHVSAADNGRRGERYIATGTPVSMRELIPSIGRAANVTTPTRRVPFALLFVIAFIQEAVARLFGKPALLSLAAVRLMRSEGDANVNYDISKSARELGYSIRPLEQTVADTVAWYRKRGELPAQKNTASLAPAQA